MDQQFSLQTYSTDDSGQRTPLATKGPYSDPLDALKATTEFFRSPVASQTGENLNNVRAAPDAPEGYVRTGPRLVTLLVTRDGTPVCEHLLNEDVELFPALSLQKAQETLLAHHHLILEGLTTPRGDNRSMTEILAQWPITSEDPADSAERHLEDLTTKKERLGQITSYYVVVADAPGLAPGTIGDESGSYRGHLGPLTTLKDAVRRAQIIKAHPQALLHDGGLPLLDRDVRITPDPRSLEADIRALGYAHFAALAGTTPDQRRYTNPCIGVASWKFSEPEGKFLFEV